jgi:type I restriction enzyme, S subunit
MRDGWVETTLGDVAEWWSGGTPRAREPKYYEGGTVPWAVIADMNKGIINSTNSYITEEALELIGGRLAPVGSVLISMYASVGKSAIANIPLATNQAIAWSIPNQDKIMPFYLYLVSQQLEHEISDSARGATQRNINRQMLRDFSFQLPPLLEQKRIVDLMSSVDSYLEALQQQLDRAKSSRNAVLHQVLNAGGDDWVDTNLAEVAVLNPSEPALSNTDHFAPMDAVHVGKRWVQYTEERRDRNGARARAGDVLFARITPCLENGKVAQVQSELQRCGGSTEFIVVRGTEKCTSDFLYFWCTLKENRDKAAELMTGTTGRQRLSWQDLGSLQLWLPSIKEQEQIVSIMSEFDSLIDSTENAISQAQNLRSALLSDLLSGEHEIPASYDKAMGAA